jgi:hypothetical protein
MSFDLAGYRTVRPPAETSRLIPSQFPPIPAFEAVSTAADLAAVFELEGWTNDRLASTRLQQLPRSSWVYGRPNASVVMASFLHGSPSGQRFSGPELGAWYASTELRTAVLEVATRLRKEISLSAIARKAETYRQYKARLDGNFIDIVGLHPEFHDPDDSTYPTSQAFGQHVRDHGATVDCVGIRYESVRRPGHENWASFLPAAVMDVVQADHYEIDVHPRGKVVVRKLS